MVDMERVITLDELVESVPEEMVRQAESQRTESRKSPKHAKSNSQKGSIDMTKELSKAQRIRNYLTANPEARNRDVVEALQQYSVTAADVANVKSISKRSGETTERSPRAKSESTGISSPGSSITLPELESGVAFVKAAGSIMRAKHLLIIIEQIKAC